MNREHPDSRLVTASVIVVLSVVAMAIVFGGAAVAATNVSIAPDDHDAGASNVVYTADGNVELSNQDTLQYVDVHIWPANVSAVNVSDVDVYIDGNEYTDGLTEFSASNGTVEFKLSNSRSISDGDRVRIVVADVTNPDDDFHANVTLHDTGDDKWQTYSDTVSIDTPANISYSDLGFDDERTAGSNTTIDVGENLTVSATVTNSGEQNGTYNASLEVDGTIVQFENDTIQANSSETVSFVTNFSSPGEYNVTIADLAVSEITVTGSLGIANGSANPATVSPGETVSNQKVYVDVANVSQDGDTDWHYVEFPNALAGNLSVNSASANATSVTSSPNLVEGYDDDGVTETVKFATSGDGGGDIALNLTVDVSIDYPDTETTYSIDARVEDSGGEVAQQSGVATIIAEGAPCICSFSVSNPSGREIAVSFNSSEELVDIEATVTNASGQTVATLTEGDFTETNESGMWVYNATYTASEDGEYTVTLQKAVDEEGSDGASGQSGTVTIDTHATAIVDGSANPATVSPGETVSNQKVYVDVADVSQDGDTDWHYVEFPNALAGNLSVNSASANATSVTSSPNLVEGYDDDGVTETVKFATSGDGGGEIALNLTVDVSIDYPEEDGTYSIDARVEDSDGDVAEKTSVATITAGDPAVPSITNYTATNPADRDIRITFDSDEELANVTVEITDSSGRIVATLTEGDFTETNESGTWVYNATYTASEDGKYETTLTEAADGDGNDGAHGQTETVTLNTVAVAIVGGSASPDEVSTGTTVNNQKVVVTLSAVSADGDTDTHFVEFPDELASGLSVNSANVNGSASIAQSAELVEGYDNDGVTDTVRFQTDTDAGGTVPLNVTVDVSVEYPVTEATYGIDVRVEDSDGDVAQQSGVTTIRAVDTSVPSITDYAVQNPSARRIEISFDVTEKLANVSIEISDGDGETIATLTENDVSGTSSDGTWTYEATYTVAEDGQYVATLTSAVDANGNDGASGQSETVTVGTSDSWTDRPPEPSIAGFDLVTTGQDVDVVVKTSHSVETLRVSVTGATDVDLARSDFSLRRQDGAYVYTADVSTGLSGRFEATITAIANNGSNGPTGRTVATVVAVPADVEASAVASPAWTGVGDSAHTFSIPVRANSSIAGETLSRIEIRYGEAFLNASGSVTSVSDDQNVVMLKVVSADGTVKSTMGWTDAVSINVVSGTVQIDLSDVDSSLKPTLVAGDRIVIRIRPVTNPETAGSYEATVALESASGHSDEATVELRIRDRGDVEALATGFVELSDDRVSVGLPGSEEIGSITIDSEDDASGALRVTVPSDPPSVASNLSEPVITTLRIDRPEAVEDDPATLTLSISTDAFGGNASALTIARYDEETGDWVQLDTSVVSRAAGTVTVKATTSETSLFAVTASEAAGETATPTPTPVPDEEATATPTPTPVPDEEATATPTEAGDQTAGGLPWYLVGIPVALLLGGTLMLARRRL